MQAERTDVVTKGRRVECRCCGHRLTVRGGQVWEHRIHDARVVVISAEKDGAIVEQLGRDERFGISYVDLLAGYRRA